MLWNLIKYKCYGAEVIYFIFSSDMENRTLFQMCSRLNLPTFLFRVRSLTLIYIASFMALAILCPSLPIILNLPSVVWPLVLWCSKIGEGGNNLWLLMLTCRTPETCHQEIIFSVFENPLELIPTSCISQQNEKYTSTCLSISIHLSVCQSVYLSIYLSLYI